MLLTKILVPTLAVLGLWACLPGPGLVGDVNPFIGTWQEKSGTIRYRLVIQPDHTAIEVYDHYQMQNDTLVLTTSDTVHGESTFMNDSNAIRILRTDTNWLPESWMSFDLRNDSLILRDWSMLVGESTELQGVWRFEPQGPRGQTLQIVTFGPDSLYTIKTVNRNAGDTLAVTGFYHDFGNAYRIRTQNGSEVLNYSYELRSGRLLARLQTDTTLRILVRSP